MDTIDTQARQCLATGVTAEGQAAPFLVAIPDAGPASRETLGGKAWSLHRLAASGFNVPPAHVLTTAFFAPWIARLRATPAWQTLTQAEQPDWPTACVALRIHVDGLEWDADQRRAIDLLASQCQAHEPGVRFAVRSSSPDEDLAAASFAGVYRTCLGVPASRLEEAIRDCFASCLAVPAFAYKSARAMPVFEPAMAVIVQRQVESEVSGVGFSINPLTNDLDEALVNASWGLGDALVDGQVVPDQFVLDKASGRLLEGTPGSKACPAPHGAGFCLDPAQLAEVTATLASVEALFGAPVDMEFAYAAGTLHLLQARPVTAYTPLTPDMTSRPGTPRTLYMDISLAKGMTINAPVSPMGQDWLKHTIAHLIRHCAGPVDLPLDRADGWLCIQGGRMYLNLSRVLWLATPLQLAHSNAPTDQLLAETLATIDATRYRSATRPSLLPLLRVVPGALWRLRRALWRSLHAFIAPDHARRLHRLRERDAMARLSAPGGKDSTLPQLQQRLGAVAIEAIVDVALPAMLAGVGATATLARLARRHCDDERRLLASLTRGAGGNLVVEMGIAMVRLARMLAPADYADTDSLAARIARREMPAAFLAEWDRFLAVYGCRGPGEMDLANASYRDDPAILLRQMSFLAGVSDERDPAAAHRRLAQERERAYTALLRRFGPVRRLLLKRLYAVSTAFAGSRDTPKHINLMFRQSMRTQALALGAKLVAEGRLDDPHDIFGLYYADLEPAHADRPDLRERRRMRTGFLQVLARQVHVFPSLIDSRGRILRAPRRDDRTGGLLGVGISPGVARGRVKCLRNAHEKSLAPGEILVAFTTDPGWTPLFVNAAAIVLEIGGALQHGALVAREFNKPCVVGIGDVFQRLRDGQLVEVDGERGIVLVIDEQAKDSVS